MTAIRVNHGALLTALDTARTLLTNKFPLARCTIADGPDGISFTAYDGNEHLHYQLEVFSGQPEPVEITVLRVELDRAVRALGKGISRRDLAGRQVTLDTAGGGVAITNGGTTLHVGTPPEFNVKQRAEPEPICDDGLVFDTTVLRTALARAEVSVGQDDTLPVLAQVLIEKGRVVSTDRFRLTVAPLRSLNEPDHTCIARVPRAVVRTLIKHAPGLETTVVSLGGPHAVSGRVRVTSGPLTITAADDGGEFVRYRPLIGRGFDAVTVLNRQDLAVALLSLKDEPRNPWAVRFTLDQAGVRADCKRDNSDEWVGLAGFGTGNEGRGVVRALGLKMLTDMVTLFTGSPSVAVGFGPGNNGIVTFAETVEDLHADGDQLRHLVMPLRLPAAMK